MQDVTVFFVEKNVRGAIMPHNFFKGKWQVWHIRPLGIYRDPKLYQTQEEAETAFGSLVEFDFDGLHQPAEWSWTAHLDGEEGYASHGTDPQDAIEHNMIRVQEDWECNDAEGGYGTEPPPELLAKWEKELREGVQQWMMADAFDFIENPFAALSRRLEDVTEEETGGDPYGSIGDDLGELAIFFEKMKSSDEHLQELLAVQARMMREIATAAGMPHKKIPMYGHLARPERWERVVSGQEQVGEAVAAILLNMVPKEQEGE